MASNFCRNCGFRLTPGKSFCANCGTMVVTPVPVQAPVVAAPVAPAVEVPAAPAAAKPVAAPAETAVTVAPAPENAAPAAVPEVEVKPQPMQTVVTYHPEESVTEQLPSDVLRPLPAVPEAPAESALQVSEANPAAIVPAEPVNAPVPAAQPAFAPAAPEASAASAAPAAPGAPKKKKHTGLVIGLICGGVALLVVIGFAVLGITKYIGSANDAKSGRTVLDRIEVMEEVSSGKNYTIYDKAFDKKIESVRWWDYDGTMKSQGVYNSSTKTLAFSVKVDDKTSEKLYFAFYYSKDNNFDSGDLKDPEVSATISPSYYKDGTAYYNIECDKSVKPGYYCVIVSKDKTFSKPYAVAYAKVVVDGDMD